MKITISDSGADYIISHLTANGYEAYYVGGCVRNAIIGKPINDYDLTTSALPNEVCSIFSHLQFFTDGIKHGTVSIYLNGKIYEVTTFRKDGDYLDHRRPEIVDFCLNVHEDLRRRDFTINAMAYNKNVGIIDDFGGIYDCKNKILRCVNNPFDRFEEDALRILRAMRFVSVYSLTVEKSTALAIKQKAELLSDVSVERVFNEFSKCILGENSNAVLSEFVEIVYLIFPELKNVNNVNKLFLAMTYAEDLTEKYAILFSQTGTTVKSICKRLKFSNSLSNAIFLLISKIDFDGYENSVKIKYLMKDLQESIFSLINVKYALATANGDTLTQNGLIKMRKICSSIIANKECYTLSDLAINGNHLIEFGINGEDIRNKLNVALDGVICGRVKNETNEILNYLGLKML